MGLEAGQTLSTVDVGVPLGGAFATWSAGGARYWSLTGHDALGEQLGRGRIARSPAPSGYAREALLVDVATGAAIVPDRFRSGTESDSDDPAMPGQLIRLQPIPRPDPTAADLHALAAWLSAVCAEAALRGELVSVESAEAPDPPERPEHQVMFGAFSGGDRWISHVLACPAPAGSTPPWSAAARDPDSGGSSLSAPLSRGTLGVVGEVIVMAVQQWDVHPLSLMVGFRPAPQGALPESALAPD